jgi:hypothetical protein
LIRHRKSPGSHTLKSYASGITRELKIDGASIFGLMAKQKKGLALFQFIILVLEVLVLGVGSNVPS